MFDIECNFTSLFTDFFFAYKIINSPMFEFI